MKVRDFKTTRYASILIILFLTLTFQYGVGIGQASIQTDDVKTPKAPIDEPLVVCEAVLFSTSNFARVHKDAEHKECLEALAKKLMELTETPLLVIDGHRDSTERGGISVTRANNFRDYLVNEMQIEASRITVRNFGDTCPAATTSEKNRRVQIWIVPADKEAPKDRAGKKCLPDSVPKLLDEEPATSADAPDRPPSNIF